MPENPFDKTVKLPAGGQIKPPVSPEKSPNIPPMQEDKTVKLSATPQYDRTVKMDAAPTAQKPAPAKEMSAPPSPAPVLLTPEDEKKTRSPLLFIGIVILLVFGLGGSWYFVPPFLKVQANKLSLLGKHQDASKKLGLALHLFPLKKVSYQVDLGRELRLSGDFPGSQKCLEEALKSKPNSYEAMRELGQSLNGMGSKEKALEIFQKCLQLKPADYEALRWSAQIAFELKKFELAQSAYENLTKSPDAQAEDFYQLGVSCYEMGKKEDARDALKSALDRNGKIKGAHALLAKLFLSGNQFADAVAQYKEELALSPSDQSLGGALSDACLQAGTYYLSLKYWNEAVSFFLDGLTASSKNLNLLHYDLSIAFMRLRKRNDALNHLGQAIQGDISFKAAAKKEPAFASMRGLPAFKKLIK